MVDVQGTDPLPLGRPGDLTDANSPGPSAPAPDRGPESGGPRPARRAHRLTARLTGGRRAILVPWVAVPLLVIGAHQLLPPGSDLRSQYQVSVLVLVCAPLLAVLLTRRSPLAHHTAAALVAGLLPALTLIALNGTDWFFSATQGDQTFRLEYATRFADDLSLSDYTYADVPAFYSPGWFWVTGLASRVTGVAAWQIYTWVAVATLYLAAVAAFALWRRTCGTRLSAALLVATVVGLPSADQGWLWHQTLLFSGAYEPYGWLVALPGPALLTWYATSRSRFDWRRGIALGAAVAAAAWLYVLYALVLAVAAALVCLWQRRERQPLELAVSGATAVVLVSPWLGPFLVRWISAGRPASDALTFIEPDDSYVRLVDAVAAPWLLLALAGAVALMAVDTTAHPRLRGLRALGATVLLLGLVQAVLGQAGQGVLFHRLLLVLGITLLAAGTLALATLLPRLRTAALPTTVGILRRPRRLFTAALTVLLFLGLGGHAREWTSRDTVAELRRLAMDTPYPDGSFPRLASAEGREAAAERPVIDDLEAAIRETSADAGQEEPGPVLTDFAPLLTVTPLHGYQQWWALYANPVAEYPRRRAFLEELAGLPPEQIVARLRAEPTAPTVFALARVPDDPSSVAFESLDWDPSRGGSLRWSVRLPVAVLEGPDFVSTTVGTYVVAALRSTV